MLPLLLPLITTLAPYAARLIGNMLNGKEGQQVAAEIEPVVTNLAIRTFGTDDPVRIEERARANPTQAAEFADKITTLAMQMETKVKLAEIQLATEVAKADAESVSNAQKHQQRLVELGSLSAWGAPVVSIVVSIGFFGIFYVMVTRPFSMDAVAAQIVNIMAGVLGSAFTAVVIYWVGGRRDAQQTSVAQSQQLSQAVEALRSSAPSVATPAVVPLPLPAPAQTQPSSITVNVPPQAGPAAPATLPTEAKASRFIGLIPLILAHEGGYVDHPKDPGGCTNRGITLRTFQDWRNAEVTCEDLKAITEEEARNIYFAKYWSPMNCDSLPPGLDLMCFDMAVNAGVRRSSEILQGILSKRDPTLKVDGVIGPLTLAAVAKTPALHLIEDFHRSRMAFYQSLPTWDTFGKGWTKRAEGTLERAKIEAGTQTAVAA